MRSKELVKNTAVIGVAKISIQIIQFFLLPIYTSYLTTSEYGDYDYLTTLGLFLVPVITLLMEESMFRFLVSAETNEEKNKIFSNTIIFIFLNSFIILSVMWVILELVHYQYTGYLLFYILGMMLYNLSTALARGMGNIKLYSFSGVLSALITILLNILFIVGMHWGVKGIMLAGSISNIVNSFIIFIASDIYHSLSLKNIDKKLIKSMLKYGIPLVPNSISWVIINLSDRLVIMNFLGSSANGIYSIANKFPNLVNTIYGFFYTAWKEAAAKVMDVEDRDVFYQNVYRVLKRILFSICLGLIGFLPLVFSLLVDENYIEAFNYIPILVIGMYFSNISGFYGGIFSAYFDTKIMGKSTAISAVVNLILTIFLINYIGVFAAVISTFASNLIVYFMRAEKIKKYIIFEKDYGFNIFCIIATIVIITGYYLSRNEINIKIFIAFFSLSFAIISNLNVIKIILKAIKRNKVLIEKG